jgi:hypothetical protein
MIENLDYVLLILRVDLFIAFGFYSLFYVVLATFIKNPVLAVIDKTATKLIAFIGIVFLLCWLTLVIANFIEISSPERDYILDRMFGRYWFGFWMQPMVWITMTQLLRMEKVRKFKALRLLFSFFFILTIEQFTLFTISFHRDFDSPFIHFSAVDIVLGIALKLVLFLSLVGVYYFVENEVKKRKGKKV